MKMKRYFLVVVIIGSSLVFLLFRDESKNNLNFLKKQIEIRSFDLLKNRLMKEEIFTSETLRVLPSSSSTEEPEPEPEPEDKFAKILRLTKCNDKNLDFFVDQRGEFLIFRNYVVAEKSYGCNEAVTLTTQGDVRFLDNLIPLVERFQGPVSVSIYAPGNDFFSALDTISYLRNCGNPLIKNLVTFHLFFENKFLPDISKGFLVNREKNIKDFYNCSEKPPYFYMEERDLFRNQKHLLYPINVARNIARLAAQTYFVLASDIELYPSLNLIRKFLDMISTKENLNNPKNVFVLPVFEVTENSSIPNSKTILQDMIRNRTAFLFHEKICKMCHTVPNYKTWLKIGDAPELNVLEKVGKRRNGFKYWEPFYIGTNNDPLFDERLTWEGQSNKMTQNYVQCLLDYNYYILDSAFLVHRPGIKKYKTQTKKFSSQIRKTNKLKKVIHKELMKIYGKRWGC